MKKNKLKLERRVKLLADEKSLLNVVAGNKREERKFAVRLQLQLPGSPA